MQSEKVDSTVNLTKQENFSSFSPYWASKFEYATALLEPYNFSVLR